MGTDIPRPVCSSYASIFMRIDALRASMRMILQVSAVFTLILLPILRCDAYHILLFYGQLFTLCGFVDILGLGALTYHIHITHGR